MNTVKVLRLGVLTLGQTPRPDGLETDVQAALGPGFEVVGRGALDLVDRAAMGALAPEPGDYVLITLLRDRGSVTVAKRKIVPLIQRQIDRLEREDEVAGTLLMCTGAFPPLGHTKPLLQPQAALYHAVLGLARSQAEGAGGRAGSGTGSRMDSHTDVRADSPVVGALVPLDEQVPQAVKQWAELGVRAVVAAANPYRDGPPELAAAARRVREGGASILFLDCFGYTAAAKASAHDGFGGPVVLARSLAARLMAEMVS